MHLQRGSITPLPHLSGRVFKSVQKCYPRDAGLGRLIQMQLSHRNPHFARMCGRSVACIQLYEGIALGYWSGLSRFQDCSTILCSIER